MKIQKPQHWFGDIFTALSISGGVIVLAAGFSGVEWLNSPFLWLAAGLLLLGLGATAAVRFHWERPAKNAVAADPPVSPISDEIQLLQALEGAKIGLWDLNLQSGAQTINSEWLEMLGYRPGEIPTDYDGWKDLVHPDDLPEVMFLLDKHLDGSLPVYEAEYRIKSSGGEWRWVRGSGRVIQWDSSGKPVRITGINRDISESKKMEEQLIAHEERLRSILFSMGEAAWSFLPDFSVLLYVNPAVEKIFGYPLGNFYNQPNFWFQQVHPEDQAAITAGIERLMQEHENELTYRIIRSDGQIRWVRSSARVVTDLGNRPIRIDGITMDVSGLNEAREALSRRDAILDAVNLVAEHLLTANSWAEILPEILDHLGRAIQASRAFIYEVFEPVAGKIYLQKLAEWLDEGIPPQPEPRLNLKAIGFQRWIEVLTPGQILKGSLADFPESERPFLAGLGVRSILMVPIHTREHWWGLIGFDECRSKREWQGVEIDALKVAASLLTAAIQRQQLFETERDERLIAQELREIANVFSESLNYDSILDRMLEQIPRIVPYDAATVLLLREDHLYVARQSGYDKIGPEVDLATSQRVFEVENAANLRLMIENRQPQVIADTRTDPGWVRVENFPFNSWVGAPLILEDRVEAILSLDKLDPNYYTSAHAARLSLFAGQASLALRNAQLFAETLEALDHERRLGEVTRAITSELDLHSTLQNVVRLAVELAGADAGSMSILDDETQVLTYPYHYNLVVTPDTTSHDSQTGLAWETIYTRKPSIVEDYAVHPRANPDWVAAGIHATISVPVIAGSICLGSLGVFALDPEFCFTPRNLALVELVGRQAGIAIRNARLFDAAHRRATEAETLRQAASVVSSALELNDVLDKILEQLKTVLPYDSAAIFLLEEGRMSLKAGRGFPNLSELMARAYPVDDSLTQAISEAHGPVIIKDARSDPRFQTWGNPGLIRGWLGLPLRVRSEIIGYLTIDSFQADAYHPSHADLALAFADEAAIALENARLFSQVQQLAITDPLTGLYNRRYFFEAARREFERARRYESPLSIIMLDLDHFKGVNDTYGHLAGDRVLTTVAGLCKGSLREVDVLARFGGEEFILLLPQTGVDGGQLLAERLRDSVARQVVEVGKEAITITASLGLAGLDSTCANVRDLVQHADRALYLSKNAGRGILTIWEPDLHTSDNIPLHDEDC